MESVVINNLYLLSVKTIYFWGAQIYTLHLIAYYIILLKDKEMFIPLL